MLIIQDDAGRTTGVIRKFSSPYAAYRHYNPGLRGLGDTNIPKTALIVGAVAAFIGVGWYLYKTDSWLMKPIWKWKWLTS